VTAEPAGPHDPAPTGATDPDGDIGGGANAGDDAGTVMAVIPAFNAAHLVGDVARAASAHLPVVVVDDGSEDATAAAAAAAGAHVVRQTPNQGKGAALQTGLRHALARGVDAIVTLDADGQHDPTEIPKLTGAWRRTGADLVIGARDFEAMPVTRRISNTLGRWALSRAVGRDIPDNQSGYRLLSRRLAEGMLDSDEPGFEFEVEMVIRCLRRGWRMEWVPVRTIYEGKGSHISPVQHVVSFFRMVARARGAVHPPGPTG
jgi:glycosyltransferase involved in cell wall biosynthesis